ncbi:MAG TPA: hypothetical protein VKG62_00925, partial [Solirubrobacteraceae bacterium]|nr:hypothetical protein [Solirubrobacteraceae bacterium]
GYYSTRRSRVRRIVVHVASDGEHIVGLSIRMPVPCRHRPRLPLELSLPSSVAAVPIRNHAARETLDVATSGEHARGQVFFSGQFDASGVLKGQVSVDIPSRSADGGYCAGTLRFTATTAGPPRL